MDVLTATRCYEQWVAGQVPLVAADLEYKHEQMRASAFMFLRATFYRWLQSFERLCPDGIIAPELLAVGDLHIENFGTWRDAEGRLVWGINDFDEAATLPYTIDLIRLATSILLAIDENHLVLEFDEACSALCEAYQKALETAGEPFVLAEGHSNLRAMATSSLRDPEAFWDKIITLPEASSGESAQARDLLCASMPAGASEFRIVRRRAGLGSLGRARFVGITSFEGGLIAREAKQITLSAASWAGFSEDAGIRYMEIVGASVRCRDPFLSLNGSWLIRRLAPDCSKIDLNLYSAGRDETKLIQAMGKETANVHLGSSAQIPAVLKHLKALPHHWLKKSATNMGDKIRDDFERFKRG